MKEYVEWLYKTLDDNISENGLDESRLILRDGSVHTGPVVDWVHEILTGLRDTAKSALEKELTK